MKLYQAPLEGITGYVYRSAYHKYYDGADRYFTPFLVGPNFSSKEKNDISPDNNAGTDTVPQILSNNSEEFISMANTLYDIYSYEEVNLNLGCPSGTVVSKHRGSGFLKVLDELDRFLEEVYTQSKPKISIKTRIGVENADNWDKIIELYNRYPLSELIIHPRFQKQGYGGKPDYDAFLFAVNNCKHDLIYNGDINSIDDYQQIGAHFPTIKGVMCGRGLLAKPWLLNELKGDDFDDSQITLLKFTDEIYRNYKDIMYGERPVMFKMKELWNFMAPNFPDAKKLLKQIRKCEKCVQYDNVITTIKANSKP